MLFACNRRLAGVGLAGRKVEKLARHTVGGLMHRRAAPGVRCLDGMRTRRSLADGLEHGRRGIRHQLRRRDHQRQAPESRSGAGQCHVLIVLNRRPQGPAAGRGRDQARSRRSMRRSFVTKSSPLGVSRSLMTPANRGSVMILRNGSGPIRPSPISWCRSSRLPRSALASQSARTYDCPPRLSSLSAQTARLER